jgi:hypothetical protein
LEGNEHGGYVMRRTFAVSVILLGLVMLISGLVVAQSTTAELTFNGNELQFEFDPASNVVVTCETYGTVLAKGYDVRGNIQEFDDRLCAPGGEVNLEQVTVLVVNPALLVDAADKSFTWQEEALTAHGRDAVLIVPVSDTQLVALVVNYYSNQEVYIFERTTRQVVFPLLNIRTLRFINGVDIPNSAQVSRVVSYTGGDITLPISPDTATNTYLDCIAECSLLWIRRYTENLHREDDWAAHWDKVKASPDNPWQFYIPADVAYAHISDDPCQTAQVLNRVTESNVFPKMSVDAVLWFSSLDDFGLGGGNGFDPATFAHSCN